MNNELIEMKFEHTMQYFLGKKAYQCAGQFNNPSHRRDWLLKTINSIMKRLDGIDTSLTHKRSLIQSTDILIQEMKSKEMPTWNSVFILLKIIGNLIGFNGCVPTFTQTVEQYYSDRIKKGGDALEQYYDKKDAISVRAGVVNNLKKDGYSDFKISLVLNVSEYEIKKLKKFTV